MSGASILFDERLGRRIDGAEGDAIVGPDEGAEAAERTRGRIEVSRGAKVDKGEAVGGHKEVAGLDVAMDDVGLVDPADRLQQLQ